MEQVQDRLSLGNQQMLQDWDVVSFDGLDSSVSIDLSQVDSNDATAISGQFTVAYVDGAEGVFGT